MQPGWGCLFKLEEEQTREESSLTKQTKLRLETLISNLNIEMSENNYLLKVVLPSETRLKSGW